MVGARGVGKSSFTMQFAESSFPDENEPLAMDGLCKNIDIDGQEVMVKVLDPTGPEQCDETRDSYLQVSQGFVLVYSVASKASFDELSQIKDRIHSIKASDCVPMILIGNKSDMEEQRVISTEDGTAQAAAWKVPFLEASARLRVNVDEAISDVVRQVLAASLGERFNSKGSSSSSSSTSKCIVL